MLQLENVGFDLSKDETYALIEPHLTKKDFDSIACVAWVRQMLDTYHRIQSMSREKYLGEYQIIRYAGLNQLIENYIPAVEERMKLADPSPHLNTLEQVELDLVLTSYRNGLLEKTFKQAANDAAIEFFRRAISSQQVGTAREKRGDNGYATEYHEGYSYAKRALQAIDDAKEYYAPQMVYTKYNGWGGFESEQSRFSKEALEDLRKFLLLKGLKAEVLQAYFRHNRFNDMDENEKLFFIDRPPLQTFLETLKHNGFDIDDPKTYEDIGTDISTFRARYAKERENLKNLKKSIPTPKPKGP